MRRFIELLLVFGVLVTGLSNETIAETPKLNPAVFDALTWPDIEDPTALISLAKAAIAKEKDRPKGTWGTDYSKKPELAYLHPAVVLADSEYFYVVLDTHPFTGQGFLILPAVVDARPVGFLADTATPEIKRVLLPLPAGEALTSRANIAYAVAFKNIQIMDREKSTSPTPLDMSLPAYPNGLMMAGIMGEAKVEFVISEKGLCEVLAVSATVSDLEAPVRETVAKWKFEPGVNRETRLPVSTHITLSIVFEFTE